MPLNWVLDTNAWVWLVEDPERLPARVRAIVADPVNYPLGLSAISPWEVAKKVSLGRLVLSLPVSGWLHRALDPSFISLLHLSPEIAVESCHLPGQFHRDPADQIIAATVRVLRAVLLTADQRLLAYPHLQSLWE